MFRWTNPWAACLLDLDFVQSFRAASSRCVNEIWSLKCQWKVIERMGTKRQAWCAFFITNSFVFNDWSPKGRRGETLHLGSNKPEPGTFGSQLSALTRWSQCTYRMSPTNVLYNWDMHKLDCPLGFVLIIPCTCTRGKVISHVHLSSLSLCLSKNASSPDPGHSISAK